MSLEGNFDFKAPLICRSVTKAVWCLTSALGCFQVIIKKHQSKYFYFAQQEPLKYEWCLCSLSSSYFSSSFISLPLFRILRSNVSSLSWVPYTCLCLTFPLSPSIWYNKGSAVCCLSGPGLSERRRRVPSLQPCLLTERSVWSLRSGQKPSFTVLCYPTPEPILNCKSVNIPAEHLGGRFCLREKKILTLSFWSVQQRYA